MRQPTRKLDNRDLMVADLMLDYSIWDYERNGNRHAAHRAAEYCLRVGLPLDWNFLPEICDLIRQDDGLPRLTRKKKGQHAREKAHNDRARRIIAYVADETARQIGFRGKEALQLAESIFKTIAREYDCAPNAGDGYISRTARKLKTDMRKADAHLKAGDEDDFDTLSLYLIRNDVSRLLEQLIATGVIVPRARADGTK
jgi:hypothetical protein